MDRGGGAAGAGKGSYGLPPLVHLRAVMDARGITREQLVSRSGLSQPTVSKVIGGAGRVRTSTAERAARAVGVPVAALYEALAFAEASGRPKLPPVVAGRDCGYPGGPGEGGGSVGWGGGGGEATPAGARDRQYVIVHRDQWAALNATLLTISGRLEAIEEAVGELATRPIAEFDVTIQERGQR